MSGAADLLMALMGGSPGVINQSLPDAAATDPASAQILFGNDGRYIYGDSLGGTVIANWVSPATSTIASFYELQVNVLSGTLATGTVDSWLDMSTSRGYSTSANAGAQSVTLRVRIREKATGLVRTDQNVTLTVTA